MEGVILFTDPDPLAVEFREVFGYGQLKCGHAIGGRHGEVIEWWCTRQRRHGRVVDGCATIEDGVIRRGRVVARQ